MATRETKRTLSVGSQRRVTTNILGQDKTLSHETICVHPGLVHIVHLNMNNNGSKETFYLLFVTRQSELIPCVAAPLL